MELRQTLSGTRQRNWKAWQEMRCIVIQGTAPAVVVIKCHGTEFFADITWRASLATTQSTRQLSMKIAEWKTWLVRISFTNPSIPSMAMSRPVTAGSKGRLVAIRHGHWILPRSGTTTGPTLDIREAPRGAQTPSFSSSASPAAAARRRPVSTSPEVTGNSTQISR